MSRHPEVLWAQRSDKVYLTISLPDAKIVNLKPEPDGKFSFSAKGVNGEPFEFELELFGKINPEVDTYNPHLIGPLTQASWMAFLFVTHYIIHLFLFFASFFIKYMESKVNSGLRNIICALHKTEKGWWKRLLKSDEKPAPYIKVDWNKWCDEDEEESSKLDGFSLDDMDDISKSEDVDDDTSDEEGMLYLPDLERVRNK